MAGFNKEKFSTDVYCRYVLLNRTTSDKLLEFIKFETEICSEMFAYYFTNQIMQKATGSPNFEITEGAVSSYLDLAVLRLKSRPDKLDDESLNQICAFNAKIFNDIYVEMKNNVEGIYLYEFERQLKSKYTEDKPGLENIIIETLIIATDFYGNNLNSYRT